LSERLSPVVLAALRVAQEVNAPAIVREAAGYMHACMISVERAAQHVLTADAIARGASRRGGGG